MAPLVQLCTIERETCLNQQNSTKHKIISKIIVMCCLKQIMSYLKCFVLIQPTRGIQALLIYMLI